MKPEVSACHCPMSVAVLLFCCQERGQTNILNFLAWLDWRSTLHFNDKRPSKNILLFICRVDKYLALAVIKNYLGALVTYRVNICNIFFQGCGLIHCSKSTVINPTKFLIQRNIVVANRGGRALIMSQIISPFTFINYILILEWS